MNIAMVNTELNRGGAARVAALLNENVNLYAKNINSVLYHCENNEKSDSVIGLRKYGSRQLNALLARLGGSFNVYDFGVADELICKVDSADLLHLHNLHGYYLNFVKLLSAWGDRPIVWTWHDMWGATGRCGISSKCNRWNNGCAICPHKDYYPAAWIDKANIEFNKKTNLFLNNKNITIVCPSQWLADIAIQRGFHADRVKVIPNPIDTSRFLLIKKTKARKELGLSNKFTILFLSSDCSDERKGYADFAKLPSNENWQYIAVGEPPAEPSLEIYHIGRIQDQSLLNMYYAAADVMVIPSYADNFPNTVIESLVSGTPVFGYNVGGIPSQLVAPSCEVIETGNISKLKYKLNEYHSRGGKSEELEKKISSFANEKWSMSKCLSNYKDIYDQVTNYDYI